MNQWDQRYINLAKEISTWSKDPSRQIGAVAIGAIGQVLSQGYNGFPRKISDTIFRLHNREAKYKYVVHAEMNCIYNACHNGISLNDSTLYVYGLPVCPECAKGIIQVGISRVVMQHPPVSHKGWEEQYDLTRHLFSEAGVEHTRYDERGLAI